MASRNRKKLAELRRVLDGAGVALTLLSLDDVEAFDEAPFVKGLRVAMFQLGRNANEPVDVLVEARLLPAKACRVHRRLDDRAPTAQPQSRPRVHPPTAKAGRAVAVSDRDRAEQSEIVQMQDRACPGLVRRSQRAPAEQRHAVVRVVE